MAVQTAVFWTGLNAMVKSAIDGTDAERCGTTLSLSTTSQRLELLRLLLGRGFELIHTATLLLQLVEQGGKIGAPVGQQVVEARAQLGNRKF